jgi:hypothetical protein
MLSEKLIYRLRWLKMHLSVILLFTAAKCYSYGVCGEVNLRFLLGLTILILFSQGPER